MTPRYRYDLQRGDLHRFIADFEASVRGEINNPENMDFLFCAEDAQAYGEFKDYLTEREMKAAFERAQRAAQ